MSNLSEFIQSLPEERKTAFEKLISGIRTHIAEGFTERWDGKMLHYEVALADYSPGYHCTPNTPLPFISVANQKGALTVYHMGIYANPTLLQWFQEAWRKEVSYKLDMGKSCIRLKKVDKIPFHLLNTLWTKMDATEWIDLYESQIKR